MRAARYDERGEPEPGAAHLPCVERDADRLVDACRAVLAQAGEGDAVAVSCFWHSLLAVDAHDRPLTPVLTWRETAGSPPPLDAAAYHRRTGCFLHPSFWPAKLRQLAAEGVRAARYLSFGDYLLLRLAGEARTSVSTASGTGLYDPNRLAWDEETLDALRLDPSLLAPVSDDAVAGVFPALGDGACANAGVDCVARGRLAVTIGTSAAARIVYAAAHAEPRPGLFLYRLDERRFCEGGALSDGGNLRAWLLATLRDVDTEAALDRPPAAHGLVVEPFLGGERFPGWDADRRGAVHGLSFATTPLDLAQAALEAVCYRLADVADALGGVEEVVASGGGLLASPGWTQLLADVLGRPVEVTGVDEASARGAAVVALERLGVAVPRLGPARVVEPRVDRHTIHLHARDVYRGLSESQEAR